MENINKKAVLYGYLSFFIPGFILTFIGLEIALVRFLLMIFGGYVTAKLAPTHEIINAFALGCVSLTLSLLMIGTIYSTTDQNYEVGSVLYDLFVTFVFSMSAPILGGALRRIVTNKGAR